MHASSPIQAKLHQLGPCPHLSDITPEEQSRGAGTVCSAVQLWAVQLNSHLALVLTITGERVLGCASPWP